MIIHAFGSKASHVWLTVRWLPQLADAERRAAEAGLSPDAERITAARRQAAREDVMYHWALAETYLQDAALQSSMRCVIVARRASAAPRSSIA